MIPPAFRFWICLARKRRGWRCKVGLLSVSTILSAKAGDWSKGVGRPHRFDVPNVLSSSSFWPPLSSKKSNSNDRVTVLDRIVLPP